MKVLIGITTRDRAVILSRAIQSALDQDYPFKQVAVFDDASTDETPQIKRKFPQVQWFHAEAPQGYLSARNQLISKAEAELYFSLDDDAWFVKGDEISQGVKLLQQNPRVAAIAYDILSPDKPQPKRRTTAYPTHMFIGCGHLLRVSAVQEVGLYIPSPGFYGSEEKDLCMRLLDHKYELLFAPGLHVWHEKTIVARDVVAQHRSGVCNDLVFTFRRCPYSMLLWLLPFKMVSHVRFAIANGLLQPCLEGIGIFFRQVFNLIPTRKPVSPVTFRKFLHRSHFTQ
jgi:glycosyltransferase involved in cell wall biosynthesis